MQQEYPFFWLYRASPRWVPSWASAQVPHSFGIWQTRSLSNWSKRQMDIFMCYWWRICSLNQFVTRISCLDSKQLQEFAKILAKRDRTLRLHTQTEGQVNCKKENSDGQNVCLDTSLHSSRIRDTDPSHHTGQVTTDHLQAGSTSPITDTRQPRGSMPHSITDFVSSPVRCDEHVSHVTIGCRQSQKGRMPSIDGTAGRGTTSSGSAGDGIEGHDQRPAFLRRRWTGTASLGSRKNEQESTSGQGPTAEYSHSREPHEGTLDSAQKGKPHAAVDTSGTELSGIRQAWSQDVSGGPEVGSRILPMDRPRGGSTIPLETPEVLFVADDAACSPGTEPAKQYDTGTPDETHQTTRGRELVRQQHWRRKIWRWRSKFGNWWNKSSCWWSLRKSLEGRDRQRVLRNSRRPQEEHNEYYEFWRDGLRRRTSTTQSQGATLKCSNDVGEEPWWIGWRLLRMCVLYFPTLFWFRITTNQSFQKRYRWLWNTSWRMPNAIGTRFLERRARFRGHRIRLPTSTFSHSVSAPTYPSHIFILQRQHEPRVASLGPREQWTPMKTRTHDDAALRDHSSWFGNVGPTFEQMTWFARVGRQQPDGLQEGVERVSTGSWVFTIRFWSMLGPGATRLTPPGNSGTRQGRDPRVTFSLQSADMSHCTIATKTLRFEELRQDRFVAKQTVWPPFNTCLGK